MINNCFLLNQGAHLSNEYDTDINKEYDTDINNEYDTDINNEYDTDINDENNEYDICCWCLTINLEAAIKMN